MRCMPRNAESFESGQAHRRSAATRDMATRAFWKTVERGSIIFWLDTAAFRHRYALTIISAISAALITTSMSVNARRESTLDWKVFVLTFPPFFERRIHLAFESLSRTNLPAVGTAVSAVRKLTALSLHSPPRPPPGATRQSRHWGWTGSSGRAKGPPLSHSWFLP